MHNTDTSFHATLEEYTQNPLSIKQVEHLKSTLEKARNFENKISLIVSFLTIIALAAFGFYLFFYFDKVLAIIFPIVLGTFIIPLFLISISDYALKNHPVFIYIDGKNYLDDIHRPALEYTQINAQNIKCSEMADTLYLNILKEGRQILEFEKNIIRNLCTI